ncbi:LPS assembly lipoprotein LptE [Methylomagnum ishizawai]|uniref:LPS-assembly lipoprotein LptE n=1 Tax=Methylomagnum ishizawai TaxID=1760988 RepID=UPI001C33A1E1|nr:LPS assembly lipoprotein LptE [Methylomagnum ishizawai]BBL76612.1 hypothetical protein MishRS11D_37100 [Methylomagnum ishizawai]
MARRLRLAAPLSAALALAACGWHLRGEMPGTKLENTLYLSGITNKNPFYGDFNQTLNNLGGALAPTPGLASAVVHITSAAHTRRPITLSQQGRANTFDLTYRVVYDVRSPKGEILIPQQELEIRRDYFNDQTTPLGQGYEEDMYRQEMQKEAARTLLRQVSYTLRQQRKTANPT